ncbi:MAG: lipopolysaccharide heptosyltransferase I, partial [Burkholderiales bacterium]|nr:lipopolysaccharide heptosyltransferase I [Burkholderiales bacterium]
MPRILLVRLSSMGDIIHNLPAVSDLVAHLPDARLDWVVEEGFAELPRLHPAIDRIIPIAMRRWRRSLMKAETRQEIATLRRTLRETHYDLVLDSQCLIKSAIVARAAGAPVYGMDWPSSREHLASLFYQRRFSAPWSLHAVERYRLLSASAFDYKAVGPVNYGLTPPALVQAWRPSGPYAVLLTATSRDDKLWPEEDWIALGQLLHADGLAVVLPWGSAKERERAERIAGVLPNATVAPRMSLTEGARLLADAKVAVGVDTGLAHLAAAVGVPVVAIYTSTDPNATGVLAASRAV